MITFQSEVGPDVMMFDAVAKRMFAILAKEPTARGVITVEQLPQAIARIEAAIAADHAAAHPPQADGDDDEATASATGGRVSLSQRALPLLELFRISLERGKPVLWGV